MNPTKQRVVIHQVFGVVIHPDALPLLLQVLENYLHYWDDNQPFLFCRSVEHLGYFVELDALKNNGKGSRKTLVPCDSIVAIVDMTEERQTPGFLGKAD